MTGPVRAAASTPVDRRPRRRNRRGEGERLRAEILDAARRLLAEQPVEMLSLRAVAREVGISPPALYLHFADRRELVWAMLEELFGELARLTSTAAQDAGLRGWCLAYCRYGLERPGHYRVLFESWNAERVDLPLSELPGHMLYQGLLAVLAPAGQADDAERHQAATLLWAGLHGLVSLRINKPSFPWPPLEQLVDGLLDRHAHS